MSFPTPKPPSSRALLRRLADRCRPALRQGVQETQADRYVKRYDSCGFALAMVSYFVLGLGSLRELQVRLSQDRCLQRAVGWGGISVSQLLKLPHRRPAALWAPLVASLLQAIGQTKHCGTVRILDTSFFTMGLKLMQRRHPKKSMSAGTAGYKLGTVLDFDSAAPVHCISAVGQSTDTAYVDALVPPGQSVRGHVFLFDRGFRKYAFFNRLIADGAQFVTRATRALHAEVQQILALDPEHPEIIADEIVLLGSRNAKNRMTHPVRRILLQSDSGLVVFLASDLQAAAWDLCELYRQRWAIEPFFRWIKSGLGCKRAVGYSQQAAEHTFWAALVAYLLTLLLAEQTTHPKTGKPTVAIKRTIQRIRAAAYQPAQQADLQALGFS